MIGLAWLALAAILMPAAIARAQSATGSIDGLVHDSTGGVLAGVAITLTQPEAGIRRTAVTDGRGTFRLPLLPVGGYTLSADLAGFEARRHEVRVFVGQTVDLRIELSVARVDQAVAVSAPVLEVTRSQVTAIVDEHAVRNLPVNGRNFLDFALLTPGVTRDVRPGDLSFAGQRGTLNSLIVDGADNNNTFAGQALGRTGSGRAPYQFSIDAVQEFQVNASSYSAEYGRAAGGVINVVTRSGTNELHGSLFEFYRDTALNATNVINELNGQPKTPYHYHQFGGTLGGPLRENRDFYFANYDGQRNRRTNLVFLNLPADTPNDPLTQAAIARLAPLAHSWDQRLDQDVFLVKTDHQVRPAHRLTLRYNHQDFTGEGYEVMGGAQNSFEHTGDSLVKTRTLSAAWAGAFGSNVFNELKVHVARDHEPGTANSGNPEAMINQSGEPVLTIGRNIFSPRSSTIDRAQVADTLTTLRGRHQVKAGFDLQLDRISNYFPGFFSGSYTFRTLASFERGRPDGPNELYLQSFAGPGTSGAESHPDVSELALFVQDAWRPRPDLTINMGLRYDLSRMDAPPATNPDPELAAAGIDTGRFEPDRNNVGPRVGLAWSPAGGNYVVRGGAGVYYGRIPAILVSASANNGVNVISTTVSGAGVPTYPQKLTEPPAGAATRPNIFYIDKDFASPRVIQANGAIEWKLGSHASLAATYVLAAGTSLSRSIDRNLGPLGERTVTVAGTGETFRYHFFGANRPFTAFQRVVAFESNAESEYHGVTLDLNRRFAGGAMFRAAYTLGRVVDTVPDATAVLINNMGDDAKYASNPADFEVDRAAGNNDQRHRLVVSGMYGVRRWSFSGIFTAQSGQPYSARVMGDLNGDGNIRNDLAPGTTRNSLRLPAVVQLDLRIARDVSLGGRMQAQLLAEAFNVFNRDNITFVRPGKYALAGTVLNPIPVFGQPLTSAGERIVQLACRVTF